MFLGKQDSAFLHLLPILYQHESSACWLKRSLFCDVTKIEDDANDLGVIWSHANANVLNRLSDRKQEHKTTNVWTNRIFLNKGGLKRSLPLSFTSLKDVYVLGPVLLDDTCDQINTIDMIVFSPQTTLQSILDAFFNNHSLFVQKKTNQSSYGETVCIHTVSSSYSCCIY